MTPEDRFSERYREGSAPWDIGQADFNLLHAAKTLPIAPCKALDIGCGTVDNVIWLSQQNFTVIGVDAVQIAIEKAREKAAKANAGCAFAVLNILNDQVDGAPFGFAFDRGCFHTLDSFGDATGTHGFLATPTVVPEPGSLPLLVACLIGLGAMARYRKRV